MTCGERMLELVQSGMALGEVSAQLRKEGLSRAWYGASDIKTVTRAYCENRGLPVPPVCRRMKRLRPYKNRLEQLLDAVGRLESALDRAGDEKTPEALKEATEADRALRELYEELRPAGAR